MNWEGHSLDDECFAVSVHTTDGETHIDCHVDDRLFAVTRANDILSDGFEVITPYIHTKIRFYPARSVVYTEIRKS